MHADEALQKVLEALRRAGCDPKPTRSGGYRARCPAHDDRRPSLSIAEQDDKILIHCFAGCDLDAILQRLGLEKRDLFNGAGPRRLPKPPAQSLPPGGKETRYEIRDADGELIAVHVRIDGPNGKTFRWERPDGTPGLGGLKVDDLPLYGSELIGTFDPQKFVVLVEGEKACLALRHRGHQALGTVCGANVTPSPEVLSVLKGFRVLLWPDADEAGLRHATGLARRLRGLGVEVYRVRIPDGKPKGWDAADADSNEIELILGTAEPWDVPPERIPGTIKSAAEILSASFPPSDPLIPGLLPEGITFLSGRPKVGKSWLALQLALGIASGGVILGKVRAGRARDVLMLDLEGNERRLQQRLSFLREVALPPNNLQCAFTWPPLADRDGTAPGLDLLARWCEEHRGGVVIVDPVGLLVRPAPKNSDPYSHFYQELQAFCNLHALYGVSFILVHHTRKTEALDPLDRLLGSTALAAAADTHWVLERARGSSDATLHVISRDLPGGEYALRWDDLHGWVFLGKAETVRLTGLKRQILEALQALGRATIQDIAAAAGVSYDVAKTTLRRLCHEGIVGREQRFFFVLKEGGDEGIQL